MMSFKQFLYERNKENKAKKVALKSKERVYRVDPLDRENVWKQSRYVSGDWGSAPRKPGQNVGDEMSGHKITNVTEPIAFATPGKPNPLYAFPRRDREGKITTAMSITTPGKRGKILTTPEGESNLKNSGPIKISSASAKGFKRNYFTGQGEDEVVSPEKIKDEKTTVVTNPEKFVKSAFDVRSGKGGKPYSSEHLRKVFYRYTRMLAAKGSNKSVSYQDNN